MTPLGNLVAVDWNVKVSPLTKETKIGNWQSAIGNWLPRQGRRNGYNYAPEKQATENPGLEISDPRPQTTKTPDKFASGQCHGYYSGSVDQSQNRAPQICFGPDVSLRGSNTISKF